MGVKWQPSARQVAVELQAFYKPFCTRKKRLIIEVRFISPAGMWGSAFAASLDDICLKVVGIGLSFLDPFKDVIKVIGKNTL